MYGKCEKISIINGEVRNGTPIIEEVSLTNDPLADGDTNVPQCEKADLEVHEKETESSGSAAAPGPSSSLM